jgi:hydroxyacylglutathione hydrolase
MQIHVIQSGVSDNYFYLLAADDGGDGILIDPIDPDAALATMSKQGLTVSRLLNTHGHPDHTGGNKKIQAELGVPLYAHAADAGWIGEIDTILSAGDTLDVGGDTLTVFHTPGHTPGHISLYTPGHLFCGDVIFVGGAGNCRFGGDPPVLFQTFRDVISSLPGETLIYPGHDYSVRNLEFALSLLPGNEAAIEKLEQARGESGLTQSTLAEERSYSPFMRLDDPILGESLTREGSGPDDAEAAFVKVRSLRDRW